jgi:thiamine biosynthesis protein ThiS
VKGPETITIRLNGEDRTVSSGLTVRRLLEDLGLRPELVVVEKNQEILARDRYADVPVEENDVLELVHFVGGG